MATNAVLMNRQAIQEPAIDLVHLTRQTLGDRMLESEVLRLFESQSRLYVERLKNAKSAEESRMAAHTILGSAKSVGAWRVASAAKRCEHDRQSAADLGELTNEVAFACEFINDLLGTQTNQLEVVG